MFFLCVYANLDTEIDYATKTSTFCANVFEHQVSWTKANHAAFDALKGNDNFKTLWDARERNGANYSKVFSSFLAKFDKSDWATGGSPWSKLKYMPELLELSDGVTQFPKQLTASEKYVVLGQDFLGRPEASNWKTAICLTSPETAPSVFSHTFALPEGHPEIPDGSWKVNQDTVKYFHNGYTFAGRRLEEQSVLDNGPEDCSSFVAKLFKLNPNNFTSANLIKQSFLSNKIIQNPTDDIQPGQIVYYPGHIAVIFGYRENTILALEYNRDRENTKIEGFGFRTFGIEQGEENLWQLAGKPDKKIQVFSINESVFSH